MSENYHFLVTETEANQRLDYFLSRQPGLGLSRSRIQGLIKEGQVRVNQQQLKSRYLLKTADEIDLSIPAPVPLQLQAEDIPLDIVYEDEGLLVVNKAPGLVVHPGAGNPGHTLVNALLAHCKNLSGIGGVQRPGIVHRLDKDTSGLLVVAKNDLVHQGLSRQMAQRKVSRQYLAIAGGTFTHTGGAIELPIGRHASHRQKMAADPRRGRPALTHYQVQEQFKHSSLLLLKLDTGRTHQIRVHLAHIRHPVLGDRTYGRWTKISLKDGGGERQEISIPRQMLHAAKLSFTHPASGRDLSFETPLPGDMQELLAALRVDLRVP